MSALVARVVPCTTARTDSAAVRDPSRSEAIPCSTACAGSFGVVRILPTRAAPVVSSITTRSVKVPPMSTPSRDATALSLHRRRDSPGKMKSKGDEHAECRCISGRGRTAERVGVRTGAGCAAAPGRHGRSVMSTVSITDRGRDLAYHVRHEVAQHPRHRRVVGRLDGERPAHASGRGRLRVPAKRHRLLRLQRDRDRAVRRQAVEDHGGSLLRISRGRASRRDPRVRCEVGARAQRQTRRLRAGRLGHRADALQVLEAHGIAESDLAASVRVSFSAAVDQLKAGAVDELMAEDGVDDLEGVLAASGLRAILVVPVRRGLEVLGALLFAARPPVRYGDDDLQIAQLLVSGLSAALETSLAYQAASDERSTLGAVLASTADAVIMQNPAGLILLANAAVRPMLGLAPEALTGQPLLAAIDYVPLRELFVAGREGVSELPLPDGRIAQASLVRVTMPFGEPVGVAVILRDITLLKSMEQMKNDFVNTVSHDLKGPITVICGLADLMRTAGPGHPSHTERCQEIRDTAQHIADLVTGLLDVSKIEAGLDSAREPVDLLSILGDALRMVTPRAEPKNIELLAELPGEAIVLAVPIRLRQALINLIDNGVKYTPAGGRVTVAAVRSFGADGAEMVTVRVTDTGIGIAASDLPHVFDKFFRVKSKATREIAGTGLGLAITRTIVEAFDGRIRVDSLEGSGATFTVELPIARS